MSLTGIDEIETFLGRTLTTVEEDRAEMLIEMAVSEIEQYLGRPVGSTEFTEDVICDTEGKVFLTNTPVLDVSSISINGEELDSQYDFEATKFGVQLFFTPSINVYDEVQVTYTAGIENKAINSLILFGVIRKMQDIAITSMASSSSSTVDIPDDTKRVRVEDYEIERFNPTTEGTKFYGNKATPLTIFSSDADFVTIKRYKKIRTA